MNIIGTGKVFSLMKAIINTSAATVPPIPCRSQKPPFPKNDGPLMPLPRSVPEDEGVCSEATLKYLDALRNDKTVNLHNIIIIKNSKIICEVALGGQRMNIWKNCYSECKSIVSLAIGIMCDENILCLDSKIVNIFGKKIPPLLWIKLKDITIRHLLTMSSTITFNEAESMITTDWLKSFFNSTTSGTLGKTFYYNSLNSYLLSAIVKEVTGLGLCEYLRPRLFEPLGISIYHWESCPSGMEKGGWGLYMLPEDMAKIGVLVMQGGVYNKKQIISQKWIRQSCSTHIKTPDELCKYDYGYHIWTSRDKNQPCFLFNGMLGQNLIGFQSKKLLIVINSGNGDIFQDNNFFKYTYKYIKTCETTATSLEKLKNQSRLQKSVALFENATLFTHRNKQKNLEGDEKYIERNFIPFVKLGEMTPVSGAASIGVFPIIMQIIQNSYCDGTKNIKFEIENNSMYLCYDEGNVKYRIEFKLRGFCENKINLGEDEYIALTEGAFATDEDGRHVLKIHITFPETPFERLIKFFINHDNSVTAEYFESPSDRLVISGFKFINDFIKSRPIIHSAANLVDIDYIDGKADRLFEPKIRYVKAKDN